MELPIIVFLVLYNNLISSVHFVEKMSWVGWSKLDNPTSSKERMKKLRNNAEKRAEENKRRNEDRKVKISNMTAD